jgi:bacterioferritin
LGGDKNRGKEQQAMTKAHKKLFADLNKDLEWEYAAAIQYVQHAAVISGAQYDSIQKELIIHSQEEMQHALMLSDQLDFLGAVPTVDVEERLVSQESLQMLKQDLAGEENAIHRYKQRIAQAEKLKEFGLRRVLEDILIQEEEHKRDLVNAIEQK